MRQSFEWVKRHRYVNHSVTFDPFKAGHVKHDYQNPKYEISMHAIFH